MSATAVTVIHKYIRREMFDFSERLFRAGPDDIGSIRSALESLVDLLHRHGEQEDSRIEPLLRQADAALADRMGNDHRRLDDQLARLCDAAGVLSPATPTCRDALLQLHLDWNRFVSAYLAHLDDEERTLFARIEHQLPPLSALADSARAQGPERAEEFLLRLWAVTTCEERSEIERAVQEAKARVEPEAVMKKSA